MLDVPMYRVYWNYTTETNYAQHIGRCTMNKFIQTQLHKTLCLSPRLVDDVYFQKSPDPAQRRVPGQVRIIGNYTDSTLLDEPIFFILMPNKTALGAYPTPSCVVLVFPTLANIFSTFTGKFNAQAYMSYKLYTKQKNIYTGISMSLYAFCISFRFVLSGPSVNLSGKFGHLPSR